MVCPPISAASINIMVRSFLQYNNADGLAVQLLQGYYKSWQDFCNKYFTYIIGNKCIYFVMQTAT